MISSGLFFIGTLGGTLVTLAVIGKKVNINETAVKLIMETAKFGTILYLINHVFHLFL